MENNIQEKQIIVTNLTKKEISPKPGQSFRAFSVYQVLGNDGVTYETTDAKTFQTFELGKTIQRT